jgi:hypothetical protein
MGSFRIFQSCEERKAFSQSNISGVKSIRIMKLNQLTGMSTTEVLFLSEDPCMLGAKYFSQRAMPSAENLLVKSCSSGIGKNEFGLFQGSAAYVLHLVGPSLHCQVRTNYPPMDSRPVK